MVGSARLTTARTPVRRARCVTVLCKKRKKGAKGAPQAGAAPADDAGVDSQKADEPGVVEAPRIVRTSFRRPKATPEELEAARKLQLEAEQEGKRMSLQEVQHHASRRQRMTVTLVDGYNVIGCWPALATLPTLAAKRAQLESYLAAYAMVNRRVVSVVYDSMKAFRAQPSSPAVQLSERSQRMMVTFSGNKSADKVLREQADDWVTLGAAEIVVVSNDKQVQHDCMRPEVDMSAMKSDWLIGECVEALRRVKARVDQEAARKLRVYRDMLRALGVNSWTEATLLPEARLKAVGMSAKKAQELMVLLG